jgi:hypothetical protein
VLVTIACAIFYLPILRAIREREFPAAQLVGHSNWMVVEALAAGAISEVASLGRANSVCAVVPGNFCWDRFVLDLDPRIVSICPWKVGGSRCFSGC